MCVKFKKDNEKTSQTERKNMAVEGDGAPAERVDAESAGVRPKLMDRGLWHQLLTVFSEIKQAPVLA